MLLEEYNELLDVLFPDGVLGFEQEVWKFREDIVDARLRKDALDEGLPPSVDYTEFVSAEFLFMFWVEAMLYSELLD